MLKKIFCGLSLGLPILLSGCAGDDPGYYITDSFGFDTVCIVDNKNVPPAFFIALRQAVADKGLTVRTVAKAEKSCPAVIVYDAKYTKKVPYLVDAKLMLIHEIGSTDIVNLKKYGSSDSLRDNLKADEPAIRAMVTRLLPRSTPW